MKKDTTASLVEFGHWVRRWRRELGYKQEELGALVGVKKQYISNIERAEPSSYTGKPSRPDIQIVDKLALAFHRPIQEARDLAGYGLPDLKPDTVEEALNSSSFFERKGIVEEDRAAIRPFLEGVDRVIERFTKSPATPQSDDIRLSYEEFERYAGGPVVKEIQSDQPKGGLINEHLRPSPPKRKPKDT